MDAGATQKRHRHAQHDKDARASQSAATAPSTAKKLETLFENLSSFCYVLTQMRRLRPFNVTADCMCRGKPQEAGCTVVAAKVVPGC